MAKVTTGLPLTFAFEVISPYRSDTLATSASLTERPPDNAMSVCESS